MAAATENRSRHRRHTATEPIAELSADHSSPCVSMRKSPLPPKKSSLPPLFSTSTSARSECPVISPRSLLPSFSLRTRPMLPPLTHCYRDRGAHVRLPAFGGEFRGQPGNQFKIADRSTDNRSGVQFLLHSFPKAVHATDPRSMRYVPLRPPVRTGQIRIQACRSTAPV
jgi:hypothetical protein